MWGNGNVHMIMGGNGNEMRKPSWEWEGMGMRDGNGRNFEWKTIPVHLKKTGDVGETSKMDKPRQYHVRWWIHGRTVDRTRWLKHKPRCTKKNAFWCKDVLSILQVTYVVRVQPFSDVIWRPRLHVGCGCVCRPSTFHAVLSSLTYIACIKCKLGAWEINQEYQNIWRDTVLTAKLIFRIGQDQL